MIYSCLWFWDHFIIEWKYGVQWTDLTSTLKKNYIFFNLASSNKLWKTIWPIILLDVCWTYELWPHKELIFQIFQSYLAKKFCLFVVLHKCAYKRQWLQQINTKIYRHNNITWLQQLPYLIFKLLYTLTIYTPIIK